MNRVWLIGLAIALAGCGGAPTGGLMVGERAPDFTAPAIGGGSVALDDLAGEPRLLVFWATWCQSCLAEIPALEKIEAVHPGRVISIALDEGGADDVTRFLEKHPLPYRVLLGSHRLFAQYDGLAIPHSVALDRDLNVVAVHRRVVDEHVLRKDLSQP